jgi:hypothetical protein
MAAHNGGSEAKMKSWRVCDSVLYTSNELSQIVITLNRSRIRIRSEMMDLDPHYSDKDP